MGVGYLTGQGGGVSNIKSIQRGTTTLSSALSEVSKDITVSSIDTSKTILLMTSRISTYSNGYSTALIAGGYIVDDTTIRFARTNVGGNDGIEIEWQLIEFKNVKTLQSGSLSISSISTNLSVSEININKSMLIFSFKYNTALDYNNYAIPTNGNITNSTQITFKQYSTTSKTVYWQLIEFK